MRERSHSQVIKIEICDGTCNLYWACAAKVIAMAMTFDSQRSSSKSKKECGTRRLGGVLRKR